MKKRLTLMTFSKLRFELRQSFCYSTKCLWVFVFSFLLLNNALAQERTLSGKVTDNTGVSLPGVSIVIKNTSNGTITDLDGNFTLKIPDNNAILVFSFVGYSTQEIKAGTQTSVNVVMVVEAGTLDEVVVIGYGTQKKKLSTGANLHVKGEDMEQKHTLQVEQAIQGLAPGVLVTANSGQPGDVYKVRIRGLGTVGNSDPLYVVDGMVTDDIKYLNNSDIESVDVLKDAASAAIYGARAANGVILITTKKGQSGAMKLSFDGYFGIQNVVKKLDMLNAKQYAEIMNEAQLNSSLKPYPLFTQDEINSMGEGTNWQDYLFNKNAPTQNYSFNINGGSDKSIYSSSLSYFKQNGIIGIEDKSQYERFSFMLNSENKLYKNILTVGENLVYTRSNSRGVGVGNAYDNTVRSFLNASPDMPVYSDTSANGYGRSLKYPMDEVNPLAVLHYTYNSKGQINKILGNLYTELEFIKGLKLTSKFGIDLSYNQTNSFDPVYFLTDMTQNKNSRAKMGIENNFRYNFENYLTYTKTFGKNNINALIGNTVEEFTRFSVSGQKEDLIIPDFDHAIINAATNKATQLTFGNKLESALLSYYGRINYNYAEKYLFSAIIRRDGSSKFGPENKYGNFPSVSAGWVMTEENFMKITWLDFLKLRGSWGRNGNDKILDYAYEAFIQSKGMDYYFGSDDVDFIGSAPDTLANPKLKWETSEQIDVGFDARLLKNFSLAFDWYKKTTKDWLVVAPISDLAGAAAPYINGGDVMNKGVEADLGFQKSFGDFSISVNGNIAYNKNEVLSIKSADSIIHGEANTLFHGHSEFYRAQPGYPIGYFYGYKAAGIFQNQADIDNYTFTDETGVPKPIQKNAKPGDVKWVDINHDGKINQFDKTMIGDPNPDFTYGLAFSAEYKGFDLSFTFQGVAGNQIVKGIRQNERAWNNYTTDILNRWHGEGTSTTQPRITADPGVNYSTISTLYVEDGDYLKLRSVNLGYDFKKSILKFLPVEKFRIYISALNLYTFTRYSGYDPEVAYGDYDATKPANFSSGIDIGHYPQPRTSLIGLNINF